MAEKDFTNNHIKQGQETNQIWSQEAGTHDTRQRTDTTFTVIIFVRFMQNGIISYRLQKVVK